MANVTIEGPSINGQRGVSVSTDNRLMVASKTNVRGYYVSRDNKRLFGATFEDAAITAGHYVAYLKNTSSTRNMFIDLIRVAADELAVWKIVTATGTATGGTTVTAVNYNRGSGITPEATILADNIGGFTAGTPLITKVRSPADTSVDVPFDDTLILTPGTAIAVECDVIASGGGDVFIRFYFEDINEV